MADKLFSVNRAVEYADLRADFEEHIFFSTGKVGYIIFSDTLENVTAGVADAYVAKGYHVGFLTDTSDAAHAYACPNDSFRAWLRSKTPAVDNLQKMINSTELLISAEAGLSGDIADFGLNWFVNIDRYLWVSLQSQCYGEVPTELANLKNSFPHWDGRIYLANMQLTGKIPHELSNLPLIKTLNLSVNQITGEIPRQFGNFEMLEGLYLNNNLLTGVIPVELGNISTLRRLHLLANNLSGYEQGAISVNQTLLNEVDARNQTSSATNTGLQSADVDQIIIDVADSVLAAPRTGTLNVAGNYPATAASITDAIERFGNLSAKAFLESKGWTVTHS